jgi:hypothetical protein
MATGVFEPECFTTPSGQAVIITDVRWRQSLPTVPPGTLIEFLIASHDPTGRQAFRAWAVTREFGQVFGEHHLESGFVFLDGMRHNFADLHGGPTIVLNGYRVTEN